MKLQAMLNIAMLVKPEISGSRFELTYFPNSRHNELLCPRKNPKIEPITMIWVKETSNRGSLQNAEGNEPARIAINTTMVTLTVIMNPLILLLTKKWSCCVLTDCFTEMFEQIK